MSLTDYCYTRDNCIEKHLNPFFSNKRKKSCKKFSESFNRDYLIGIFQTFRNLFAEGKGEGIFHSSFFNKYLHKKPNQKMRMLVN